MTGRVHILSRPLEHPRHQRCINILDSDDTLVLTEAALGLLERPSPLENVRAGSIIALEETLETLSLPEGVDFMDHATFVDRVLTRHQPVFW